MHDKTLYVEQIQSVFSEKSPKKIEYVDTKCSPAFFLDRLSILYVKSMNLTRDNFVDKLLPTLMEFLLINKDFTFDRTSLKFFVALSEIHSILWSMENKVREQLDPYSKLEAYQAITRFNDKRAALKTQIDQYYQATISDLKQHGNSIDDRISTSI